VILPTPGQPDMRVATGHRSGDLDGLEKKAWKGWLMQQARNPEHRSVTGPFRRHPVTPVPRLSTRYPQKNVDNR